ncbi:carboxypeptidase-like regulatory domain-containing protein [Anaerovorax sp. IOR16]|uniref:carboxypeptidase-like regulatory domain-containing protein n=1 Tax=Anaerovorax sp. IOR16 TaxID=2773458 RepID=UPI0019CFD399|nr:carboxypeptidase-like regulatory domain-containing protein [Anaerovorax sp. IOR16]
MNHELNSKNKQLFHRMNENSSNLSEDFSVAELLERYTTENSKIGYLLFKIETALGTLPVPNAKVTVSKPLGNGYYISKVVMTDIDGKTETFALPTVSAELSQAPGIIRPYSIYDVTVSAPGYFDVELFNIPIFENITAVQPINLFPDLGFGSGQKIEQIYDIYPTGPEIFKRGYFL